MKLYCETKTEGAKEGGDDVKNDTFFFLLEDEDDVDLTGKASEREAGNL